MHSEEKIHKSSTDYHKILKRLLVIVVVGVLAHVLFILSTTEKDAIKLVFNLKALHISTILVFIHISWSMYALRILLWASFLKEKITFLQAFRVVITSEIASAVSPTSVGGAPVKAGLLLQKKFQPGNVGFILTYGVIEDLFFYLTGVILACFFSAGILISSGKLFLLKMELFISEILLLVLMVSMMILLYKKGFLYPLNSIRRFIPVSIMSLFDKLRNNFLLGMGDMKKNYVFVTSNGKKYMVTSFLLLLFQWMAKFSILVVMLHAFNIDIPFFETYIKQWIVQVMMLFIPTPGASGGAEASFLLIFDRYFPAQLSFVMVSIWRLFTYYLILVVAVATFLFIPFIVKGWHKLCA